MTGIFPDVHFLSFNKHLWSYWNCVGRLHILISLNAIFLSIMYLFANILQNLPRVCKEVRYLCYSQDSHKLQQNYLIQKEISIKVTYCTFYGKKLMFNYITNTLCWYTTIPSKLHFKIN